VYYRASIASIKRVLCAPTINSRADDCYSHKLLLLLPPLSISRVVFHPNTGDYRGVTSPAQQ